MDEVLYAHGPIQTVTFEDPNDTYYQTDQWNLAKINAPKAWDITKGDNNMAVAIIDPEGDVCGYHPDLGNKVLGSQAYYGSHATECAGVVGALTNNGEGIAALGWNLKIYSKWCYNTSEVNVTNAINAVIANPSVKVINISFGTVDTRPLNCNYPGKTCYQYVPINYPEVENAINKAVSMGIVVVAASGNHDHNANLGYDQGCDSSCTHSNDGALGLGVDIYPAACQNVIAVAATDINEGRENYYYGSYIDVSAPGIGIKTTSYYRDGSNYIYPNYIFDSGTSLAAPHVAALAGLILSVIQVPQDRVVEDVRKIIQNTAVDIGDPGVDIYYGYGRIDAYKALKYALENYGGVLAQNLTIPAGETWNFKSGITVTFQNNASLVVNGNLNANGVTFDFISGNSTYANGIKLLPGSTASISNSTIKNAYRGIDFNHAYLSLSGSSTITGCSSHGIYMYNENGVSNRSVISNCNIFGNTGSGIVLYYSSPIVTDNHIYSNYYGMGVADYSAPSLGYMGSRGWNHIYSNRFHGFSANRNSNPFLGEDICMLNGGYNKINDNTQYNVSVYGNSIVTAENNWWEYLPDGVTINTAKFYISSGAFDYLPPADPMDPSRNFSLVSSPASGQSSPEEMLYDRQFTPSSSGSQSKEMANEKLIASSGRDSSQVNAEFKAPSAYDEKWSMLKKLTYARYMHFLNRDLEAEEICKKVIESFPDSSLSYYALDILWQSARKSRMEDFKSYLNIIKSNLDGKPVSLMAEILQARFEKENRIKLLDELSSKIKNMPPKDLSPRARQDIMESLLFSKLLHYLNDEKNVSKAKELVTEIDALVGMGSHSSVEAHMLVGDDIPENDILSKDLKSSEESASIDKPTEYSLSGNYPNPFNPSTRIDYALPMTSKVELRVYDILGHEVATLVNSVQEAGRYSAMFNASDVTSGLYIYKIRSQSLENGKVFEKTGKMMFMK